jgi:hypothetical protein
MAVKSQRSIAVFLGLTPPRRLGTPSRGTSCAKYSRASRRGKFSPENAIGRILKGEPVGLALKDFYERYATVQPGQMYDRVVQVDGNHWHQS